MTVRRFKQLEISVSSSFEQLPTAIVSDFYFLNYFIDIYEYTKPSRKYVAPRTFSLHRLHLLFYILRSCRNQEKQEGSHFLDFGLTSKILTFKSFTELDLCHRSPFVVPNLLYSWKINCSSEHTKSCKSNILFRLTVEKNYKHPSLRILTERFVYSRD